MGRGGARERESERGNQTQTQTQTQTERAREGESESGASKSESERGRWDDQYQCNIILDRVNSLSKTRRCAFLARTANLALSYVGGVVFFIFFLWGSAESLDDGEEVGADEEYMTEEEYKEELQAKIRDAGIKVKALEAGMRP